jgi:hypothetical protein
MDVRFTVLLLLLSTDKKKLCVVVKDERMRQRMSTSLVNAAFECECYLRSKVAQCAEGRCSLQYEDCKPG